MLFMWRNSLICCMRNHGETIKRPADSESWESACFYVITVKCLFYQSFMLESMKSDSRYFLDRGTTQLGGGPTGWPRFMRLWVCLLGHEAMSVFISHHGGYWWLSSTGQSRCNVIRGPTYRLIHVSGILCQQAMRWGNLRQAGRRCRGPGQKG